MILKLSIKGALDLFSILKTIMLFQLNFNNLKNLFSLTAKYIESEFYMC